MATESNQSDMAIEPKKMRHGYRVKSIRYGYRAKKNATWLQSQINETENNPSPNYIL
ncbi:hypothetical protein CHS0354_042539, partial [Potamilus streckersoni]